MKYLVAIACTIALALAVAWRFLATSDLAFAPACNCHAKCICGRGGDPACHCGTVTESARFGRRCHLRCRCDHSEKVE